MNTRLAWSCLVAACLLLLPAVAWAEVDCADGVDNDGDGVADCDDPDCIDVDADSDGIGVCAGDCDDGDPAVHPEATERACDGVDNNCSGADLTDWDDDGYECAGAGGDDCDDFDPLRHPGAYELCDGIDNDCDCAFGEPTCDEVDEEPDLDEDGFTWCEGDCNDFDPRVGPGPSDEVCDGADSDCDGVLAAEELDLDGDGVPTCAGDCDDRNPAIAPGLPEVCEDEVDHNCDGTAGGTGDVDGDGSDPCTGDCVDTDDSIGPEAPELCNGVDDDCDGEVDEDFDLDVDGWVDLSLPECLGAPPGLRGDCDDQDAAVSPARLERCDGLGVDDDCDGLIDEDLDQDRDGWSTCGGDCNDANPAVSPGALELCDGRDNDCDREADEGFDRDGDGFLTCAGDCNDDRPEVNPAAEDVCDLVDNDCDGEIDDGLDGDGDGFCAPLDCDDEDALVVPGADELCDGVDNNCNGFADEGYDQDGDGWSECAGDCDDRPELGTAAAPDLPEVCTDDVDNDCDNFIDTDDDSCPGPGERDLPYGFSCGTAGGAPLTPVVGLALLCGLAVGRRRRRGGAVLALLAGALLVGAVLAPGPASADDERDVDLILYLSNTPDRAAEAELELAEREVGMVDGVAAMEARTWLARQVPAVHLASAVPPHRCQGESEDVGALLRAARRASSALEYADSLLALSDAVDVLPCSSRPIDPRSLSDLFFYKGYARAIEGELTEAVRAFSLAVAVDPSMRWDEDLSPRAEPLFRAVQRHILGEDAPTATRADTPVGTSQEEVIAGLDARETPRPARIVVDLPGGEFAAFWVDGRGHVPGRWEAPLLPGWHLLQWAGPDGRVEGALFEVGEADEIDVLGVDGQASLLLDAAADAERTERAWAILSTIETLPDHVVVLDLLDEAEPGERRATVFERWTQNALRVPTRADLERARIAAGGRPYRPDVARIVVSGGYTYAHPYSYIATALDLDIALGRTPLLFALGGELGVHPAGGEDDPLILLPSASIGLGVRFADRLARPVLSVHALVGGDSLDSLAPGGDVRLTLDLLAHGSSPVVLRLRTRVGMQAFRYTTPSGDLTPLHVVPRAGVELGIGVRALRRGDREVSP